jgi:broad specificity phosphatase PhoE
VIERNPPIYFVRHGETDWNRESRVQGQIDIPLNDTGHGQSEAVARALKEHLGSTGIDRFVTSPLTRARQTMGYVCREFVWPEVRVEVTPAMLELAFGVWEGRYFREMTADPSYPKDLLSHFRWRPKDGESYEDGLDRVTEWIGRIDGPTVIVAHGAIGRCLIGLVSDLTPEDLVRAPTPQGSFCRLENGQIDWFNADGDAVYSTP